MYFSRETIFNLNCYNSFTLYMGDANPPREPLHHSLTFVIGRETDWTEEILSSLALKHYDYCIKAIINRRVLDLKSIIIEIGNFLSAQCGNKMLHYKADLNVLHLLYISTWNIVWDRLVCISRFFNQDV